MYKQKSSSHIHFLINDDEECRAGRSRRKAFLWNRQERHTSLSVDWIVSTDVSVNMSKSFILTGNQKNVKDLTNLQKISSSST